MWLRYPDYLMYHIVMFSLFTWSLSMVLLLLCTAVDATDSFLACLPEGIHPDEVVSVQQAKSGKSDLARKLTVREALTRVKARCKNGKLLDGAGKEIRIVRLIGCWGNPPEDYQEQLERQGKEIERLKKKYTVIEIPCSQSDPRLIS